MYEQPSDLTISIVLPQEHIAINSSYQEPVPPSLIDESQEHIYHNQSVQSSRFAFWQKVYQFPFGKSSSKLREESSSGVKSSVSTAHDAWNMFNPQKKPTFQFDIYQMLANKPSLIPPTSSKQQTNIQAQSIYYQEKQQIQNYYSQNQSEAINTVPYQTNYNKNSSFSLSMPFQKDYKPFSCFQPNSYEKQQIQNPYKDNEKLNQMNLSKISEIKQITDKNKYFFQISSNQSEQIDQEKDIQDLLIKENNISQIKMVQEDNQSGLWNYQALLQPMKSFKKRDLGWDIQNEFLVQSVKQSSIFQIYRENNLSYIQRMQEQINLSQEMREVLSDEYVIVEISKMLQNVECQLFTLDYIKMQWSLELTKYRLQHSFRSSLKYQIEQILLLASYRSRIDVALDYIRKRPYRKIYYELGARIQQILIFFEETVLQQSKRSFIIEYFLKIGKLRQQIRIIYKLLINESAIIEQGRTYQNFDYRYLNSEYVIFKEITKMAKFNDSLNLDITPLISCLMNAAFKPIITILNQILFEQYTTIQLNDELYLKYYFDNHKDILNFISKKIDLIKKESNEIYLICKIKQDIHIVQDMHELAQYEAKWERNFNQKHKYLKNIIKNYKLKVRTQREKKEHERMKQIYELKTKLYKEKEQQNSKIRQSKQRNREQLIKLKREIEAKEQRRTLLQKIQKEKEKGLLLDLQLRQKLSLKKQKDILSQKMSQIQSGNSKIQVEKTQVQNSVLLISRQKIQAQIQDINIVQQQQNNKPLRAQNEIRSINPKSEDIIQSSKQLEPKPLAISADNFFIKKQNNKEKKLHGLKKKDSYFKMIKDTTIENKSIHVDNDQMDSMEIESNSSIEDEKKQLLITVNRDVNINTSLEICINDVIKKQIEIIQASLRFIVIEKYQILEIFTFMKNTFMSGNAEKIHELLVVAVDRHSKLNLKYFSECMLFDTNVQIIQKLQPSFYYCKNNKFNTEVDIFTENVQNYIGFEFKKIPSILEQYFSYFHLSKYMQIFNFMLKLKHCEKLISKSWKLLNNYYRQLQRKKAQGYELSLEHALLKKMFNVRYIINQFIIIFQNYMFLKVIEKQFKKMMNNIDNLDQIQVSHHEMLDYIIKYSFIDNQNHNISQNFRKMLRKMLNEIHKFYNIVLQMTIDDLPKYKYQQVSNQIEEISKKFNKQLKNVQNLIYKLN